MGIQNLLRPQSGGGNLMESGSHIKYSSGATFRLKVDQVSLEAQCPLIDATQETDDYVTWKHTNRVTGIVRLTGHVISGANVGFNNLPDEEVMVHLVLGKTGDDADDYHVLRFKIAATAMVLQYSRQSPTVPIQIEGRITKSATIGGTTRSVCEAITTISAQ
tara:strand:- start:474 stop:959 length:486 start_codon:yes stop_codon:yes gene_type:complete